MRIKIILYTVKDPFCMLRAHVTEKKKSCSSSCKCVTAGSYCHHTETTVDSHRV